MIGLMVVTVLLGGIPILASRPARVVDGFVVVPLDPFVRCVAQLVQVDREEGTIVVARDATSVVVRLRDDATDTPDGTIYVRLAPIVRGLGGTVTFDAVRKVAAVEMPQPRPVTSPTPFDPSNPTVTPRRVFTPEPTVTPRPTTSGVPQPRRTPVSVVPSFPLGTGCEHAAKPMDGRER